MRSLIHSQIVRWCSSAALALLLGSGGYALAQSQTTAPPPPPDAQQSLQQQPTSSSTRAVRLSDVEGSVRVLENGQLAFEQAQVNMPVVQGMQFITANDGRVEIEFEDGSVARITPNSSLTITKLASESNGTPVTVMTANTGLTYYELNSDSGQYSVNFAPAVQDTITPLGSSIFRVDVDSPPAQVAVMHGSVKVTNSQGLQAELDTNQTGLFNEQNPNEYQLQQQVSANSWDQWNSDRDQALAENEQQAGAEGNPSNPAWDALDANGNWYDVPGYGMGWSPSGVGEDWDPYGLGSWGYYNGIGYTWISGYSWGWWPYRCGAWSWFDNFGWMWFPGSCGMYGFGSGFGWYPYTVIWTVPPNYRVPHCPKEIRGGGRGHGKMPNPTPYKRPPLIAVNRGGQFTQQFRSVGNVGPAPAPRTLMFHGQKIQPIHLKGVGSSTVGPSISRGSLIRPAYRGPMYQPQGGRTTYQPRARAPLSGNRMSRPPAPVYRAPVYRAPSAPSFHPQYHAPAPQFHAPAMPSFHPAPAPSFHAPAPAAGGHGRR